VPQKEHNLLTILMTFQIKKRINSQLLIDAMETLFEDWVTNKHDSMINIGAIHVGNMHANFQASSSIGMGGGGGEGWKDRRWTSLCFPVIRLQVSNYRKKTPSIK